MSILILICSVVVVPFGLVPYLWMKFCNRYMEGPQMSFLDALNDQLSYPVIPGLAIGIGFIISLFHLFKATR